MKIFMIGATGLLGSAGADELIKRGHEVVGISLPPIPKDSDINPEIKLSLGNYLELSDDELRDYLRGCEGFVFAAGVDERVEFAPPCYDAYVKYNIQPVQRILKIAQEEGVKKSVILGSYFSYFAKNYPELKLYEKNPYIRSRIDQENAAFSYSNKGMEVMVLELPYIFGIQKGRKPVWTVILEQILKMKKNTYYPGGGTTMVTVKQVAECIAGAIEKGEGGTAYPVGYYNMTWVEFLKIVHKSIGMPERKVITIPKWLYKIFAKNIIKEYKEKNVEPGLDPYSLGDLMSMNLFIDRDIIQEKLGATDDDIEKAIDDSFKLSMQVLKGEQEVIGMKAE